MTLSKMSLAVALSGVMVLTACDEMNDPNNPNRNTQQGAALGAAAGVFSNALKARVGVLNKLTAILFGGLAAKLVID